MNKKNNKITNCDLFRYKYSEAELIENINNLDIKYILDTQTLSAKFCVEYILNMDNINDGSEESYLFDKTHILKKQKHLRECDLSNVK